MKFGKTWFFALIAGLIVSPVVAQPKPATAIVESPRAFVQEFYNWYVPKANAGGKISASDTALKQKKMDFDSALETALLQDAEAQRKTPGEIVGIDFDPFLNTQDPLKHYEVGKIVQKGDVYLLDIHGIQGVKKHGVPDVIAEVAKNGGRWCFVNFHYPNSNQSLIAVLKALAADRESVKKTDK